MKETEIANQLVDHGEHDGPDLVKVDVQIRTGGMILPPSWLNPARQVQTAKPSKR